MSGFKPMTCDSDGCFLVPQGSCTYCLESNNDKQLKVKHTLHAAQYTRLLMKFVARQMMKFSF